MNIFITVIHSLLTVRLLVPCQKTRKSLSKCRVQKSDTSCRECPHQSVVLPLPFHDILKSLYFPVKFIDARTSFACDINVNEQLGLRNTGMIKRYCDVIPILRPMVWSLKRWAKGLGMNDPSGNRGAVTFSSYALMLMTISFLQVSE